MTEAAAPLRAGAVPVELSLPDPGGALVAVRLVSDVTVLPDRHDYRRAADGVWRLRLAVPVVHRLEYRLELTDRDGRTVTTPDPGNRHRADGPFGAASVLELPGYAPPDWLTGRAAAGTSRWLELPSRGLREPVRCLLWSPKGVDPATPLPLLVAHDGPELAHYGGLLRCLAVLVRRGRLPALRAALLAPGERNEEYTASTGYAGALANGLLPALEREVATTARLGMGASLGALAMLHAHRRVPGTFAGLLLQSGSYFTPRTDAMESWLSRFGRITRFVASVLRAAPDYPDPVPVTLSCGLAEENLENNRLMARALRAQGYPVRFVQWPDAHNWVSWRDAWQTCLPHLLAAAGAGR